MKILKELVIIFFAGLGLHRVIQDLMLWIDPGLIAEKSTGYFSVAAFLVLYVLIKYLKQRDNNRLAEKETEAVH